MKIQVMGPGCRRCDQLHQNALEAAARMEDGPDIDVEKVKDIDALYRLGVFVTPALVIDGHVASSGKLLSTEDIVEEIHKRLAG
jgi:small redox-active disulfide protein 2